MLKPLHWLSAQIAVRWQILQDARDDDRGSVVEAVVIIGGLAVLAIGVMAAVKGFVDREVVNLNP